ncbi:MAG: F0F1 ATP synthase subunit A [Xanthobacteraceae bacterium]
MISFLTRPISHSVRLFANMLAGHMTLSVFAAFVVMRHWGGGLAGRFFTTRTHSCAHRVVAVLQAYVFAILTCIYLRDALHPGH